ncbi:PIR protein [Plasmodium sp. gorilla clade G1]|nr:PIR protein [Plasmodium sp. gorilla clade G1]
MKLHGSKILLFSLPLYILAHNKKKPYITRYIPNTTSRVLSECDIPSSIYDNDPDIKSVKENFDRQTSQRFEEYEERMITQRKKYKEQCDKDIKNIILKDKVQNSLAEKVEKGCLRCGCGLGGIGAGVGIFGALGTYGWEIAATATAYETAKKTGIQAGIQAVITKIKGTMAFKDIWNVEWEKIINGSNYNSISGLSRATESAMDSIGKPCMSYGYERACSGISANSNYWLGEAAEAGKQAAVDATAAAKEAELVKLTTTSSNAYSAIGYSVTAILIIVLVMVILYLILRYRRKKKMNKKAHYTKLLNK